MNSDSSKYRIAVVGALGVITAAIIAGIFLLHDTATKTSAGIASEERKRDAALTEKKQKFLKGLILESTSLKERLIDARDSLGSSNIRSINASYSNLERAFKDWRLIVDERRETTSTMFGELEAQLIYDTAGSGITVDNCGIVTHWDNITESENCKRTFRQHSQELQKLQDSRNSANIGDYQVSDDIIIPRDLHTSFRVAKELVQFRLSCLRQQLEKENSKNEKSELMCPPGDGAQYAMQLRVNLAARNVGRLGDAFKSE